MEFSHLPDISLEGPVTLETSSANLYCMLSALIKTTECKKDERHNTLIERILITGMHN